MRAWNPAQPLTPVGAAATDQSSPGATLAVQPYQQDAGTAGVIHGLFLVHVANAALSEALVLDVFAPGPAEVARDWKTLTDFAGTLLRHQSLTSPSPGPSPQPGQPGTPGPEGYIPDPVPSEHLTVNVINKAKHDQAETAAKIWFDHFPNQPLPSYDAGMIYATMLTRLPPDSNSRGPIRELLDRYNKMIESFGIGR
jgi:hypothetical protein